METRSGEFLLRNPGGMVPFWFWNGTMEEEEIARQLELAAEAGLRGMCLHARVGNQIEYMSERWLELVQWACRKAQELGLEIWLYDEEGFPSGSVGGRLPAKGAPYRQRALSFAKCKASEATSALRVFAMDDLVHPADAKQLPPETPVLAFTIVDVGPHPYIDTLSRIPTDAFLEMTHKRYFEKLKGYFGSVLPFVYTDDVNHLLDGAHRPLLSWTPALEEVFRSRWGYSLLDRLPYLIEDLPGCAKVRLHYRKTIRDLFLSNFMMPIAAWCHAHRVRLLGHLSGDEGPFSKMLCRYTDPMAFYMTEDIPGIDDFTAGREDGRYLSEPVNIEKKSMLLLCKAAASVAHQFKQGKCSSEILTALGWGVPLHQILSQLNVNMALGMNVLTPHAYSYTTGKVAKRDFPPSYFFQQPWFRFHKEVFAAAENSLKLLRRGEPATKLLILHPFSSEAVSSGADSITMTKQQQHHNPLFVDPDEHYFSLAALLLQLERMHVAYAFGHEETLGKAGKIENGKLRLGEAAYEEVLLPGCVNIDRRFLALLQRFAAKGGKISYVDRLPSFIDGEECHEDFSFIQPFAIMPEPLPFTAENPEEILVHRRLVDGHEEYFLVNCTGHTQHIELTAAGLYIYNPEHDQNEGKSMSLLHGHGCHILPGKPVEKKTDSGKWETLFADWNIQAQRGNLAMFDYAALPDGSVHYFGSFPKHEAGIRLTTPINLPQISGEVILWTENPNIQVNGYEVRNFSRVHEANRALAGADISAFLRSGDNEIVQISDGGRPEMFYLEGDFQVRLQDNCFRIDPPGKIPFGNAASCMPFYWGELLYSTSFHAENGKGRLSLYGEGAVKPIINGQEMPLLFTMPETLEFPLCNGENTIELILANTAQNLFGNHREFALTTDYSRDEARTVNSCRPPIMGEKEDSLAVMPFGLEKIDLEIEKD